MYSNVHWFTILYLLYNILMDLCSRAYPVYTVGEGASNYNGTGPGGQWYASAGGGGGQQASHHYLISGAPAEEAVGPMQRSSPQTVAAVSLKTNNQTFLPCACGDRVPNLTCIDKILYDSVFILNTPYCHWGGINAFD